MIVWPDALAKNGNADCDTDSSKLSRPGMYISELLFPV